MTKAAKRLIRDLMEAGVDPDLVARVALMVSDSVAAAQAEQRRERRAADTERKRQKREEHKKAEAEKVKQDATEIGTISEQTCPQKSADIADKCGHVCSPDVPIVASDVVICSSLLRKEDSKIDADDDARARAPGFFKPETVALVIALLRVIGIAPDALPPAWYDIHGRIQRWLEGGWKSEIILETVRRVMANKRDGPPRSPRYFEGAIADAHAQAAAPLPVGTARAPPQNRPQTASERKREAWENVRQRAREYASRPEGSGEVDEQADRFLPAQCGKRP